MVELKISIGDVDLLPVCEDVGALDLVCNVGANFDTGELIDECTIEVDVDTLPLSDD